MIDMRPYIRQPGAVGGGADYMIHLPPTENFSRTQELSKTLDYDRIRNQYKLLERS